MVVVGQGSERAMSGGSGVVGLGSEGAVISGSVGGWTGRGESNDQLKWWLLDREVREQ